MDAAAEPAFCQMLLLVPMSQIQLLLPMSQIRLFDVNADLAAMWSLNCANNTKVLETIVLLALTILW